MESKAPQGPRGSARSVRSSDVPRIAPEEGGGVVAASLSPSEPAATFATGKGRRPPRGFRAPESARFQNGRRAVPIFCDKEREEITAGLGGAAVETWGPRRAPRRAGSRRRCVLGEAGSE